MGVFKSENIKVGHFYGIAFIIALILAFWNFATSLFFRVKTEATIDATGMFYITGNFWLPYAIFISAWASALLVLL